ncbi:MAG: ABC transporter substrate-binding protein [Betaproteobacteria bacterium]|nr:ABC transporter substrate-binding protein [Betaproteobacteria bacterium]
MNSHITRLAAVLAAGLFCAAPAQSADRVKIGFISTLSGPSAALGIDMRDAFNLAVKLQGGKLGGLPAEVLVQDDQLNPEAGKQIADRMVKRDRVDFVTGITFSNVLLAAAPVVIEAGKIYISSNAGPSPLAGAQCNRQVFVVSYQNDSNTGSGPALIANNRGFKNIVGIAPNYPTGQDAISGFKSTYKGKLRDEIFTKLGQLDYATELAQIRAAKPDAVFYFLPGGMGINFIKQFVAAGLSKDITLITSNSGADEDIIKAVGEPMLGLLNSSGWGHDMTNPENLKFVSAFEAEYKRLPSIYAAMAYDTAMLIDAAVRDAKGKLEDKEAVIKALRAKRFKSVRGDFKWQNNNYPMQDWHLRIIGKDAKGRITNKIIGSLAKDFGDLHAASCPLKW